MLLRSDTYNLSDAILLRVKRMSFRSLIDAVVFMHTNSVAHLDIKPDNLPVDVNHSSHHLRVTDFSLSVWVDGEDDTIEGYAGTPGWTAPEIGDENGPVQKYSPILAESAT
jgi:serine/threonine protein kinase